MEHDSIAHYGAVYHIIVSMACILYYKQQPSNVDRIIGYNTIKELCR